MTFVERWKRNFKKGDRLPNAYLFQGPKGSGKKKAAEEITNILLGGMENHPDFLKITPGKKTIGIETIRELIEKLALKPVESDYRVVVIEEADSMTEAAANALLKTLEEPPPHTVFILISEVPEGLPATIRSRCQKSTFQINKEKIREDLKTLFDLWSDRLLPLFENGKTGGTSFSHLSQFAESVSKDAEQIPSLIELLMSLWHDLVACHDDVPLLLPDAVDWIRREACRRDHDQLFQEFDLILQTKRAIEGNVNKTLALERLFLRLLAVPCHSETTGSIDPSETRSSGALRTDGSFV